MFGFIGIVELFIECGIVFGFCDFELRSWVNIVELVVIIVDCIGLFIIDDDVVVSGSVVGIVILVIGSMGLDSVVVSDLGGGKC